LTFALVKLIVGTKKKHTCLPEFTKDNGILKKWLDNSDFIFFKFELNDILSTIKAFKYE